MPDTVIAYTHRIGRTGRMTKLGTAISLVTQDDLPMISCDRATSGQPDGVAKTDRVLAGQENTFPHKGKIYFSIFAYPPGVIEPIARKAKIQTSCKKCRNHAQNEAQRVSSIDFPSTQPRKAARSTPMTP